MTTKNTEKPEMEKSKMTCGIIMPIAPHPDYSSDHWKDVLNILTEAVNETEFEPKLVSDDVAIGLIHDRIVTNIYNNEIVICDVSSKNPNVMFELGLRLAFDKPTIIVKDESTGYSFDTGVIEHIPYPSSLRFSQIVKFKEELIRRINATYKKAKTEPNYSPFLKSFGKTIVPASLQETEIPEGKYILSQLENLNKEMQIMRIEQRRDTDIRRRNLSMLNDQEKYKILSNLLNNYRHKYSYNELLDNSKFNSILRNELAVNGVDISSNELKDFILTYYNNLSDKDKMK